MATAEATSDYPGVDATNYRTIGRTTSVSDGQGHRAPKEVVPTDRMVEGTSFVPSRSGTWIAKSYQVSDGTP